MTAKVESIRRSSKRKLSMVQIMALHEIMRTGLNGYDQIVEGKVVRIPFTLGTTNLKIARNQNRLTPLVESFNAARNKLIMELSNGTGQLKPSDDPAVLRRFAEAQQEWAAVEEEVDLLSFTEAELNLEINPISPNVLAVLDETGLIA